MKIYGFQKLTLLDYPEHVAATAFTGGCNFRCPFCHNGDLVLLPEGKACLSEAEILAILKKRQGMLQGLCITGGEPTLQPDLPDFIRKVKELDYAVKLDTNGYRPDVLKSLLEEELLDYVAMDVKASLENYGTTVGVPNMDVKLIRESIELLKNGRVPYEFRTTVVRGIHRTEDFEQIGKQLAGSRVYYLQSFRECDNMLVTVEGARHELGCVRPQEMLSTKGTEKMGRFSAFSKAEMENIANIARKYIDRVELRGVE